MGNTSKKINVTGTPTFFFSGQEANRALGLTDTRSIEEFLHEVMKKTAEGPF